MNIGILNEKHGIMVLEGIEDLGHLQVEMIKRKLPEGCNLNDFAFMYMPDRDWIVINKGHRMYDFYSQTIPVYLELSADTRQKCTEQAPVETIKQAWRILDDVIYRRKLLYRKVVS